MERKTQKLKKNKGGKKTQIINKKSLSVLKKLFFHFLMSFTLFFFEKQYDLKAFNCFH
jgi:hypothetical protein